MPKGELLGEFELYVLLALVRLDSEAYGIAIRREIAARTGRDVAIGAVYATLSRLEDKGLLRHTLSEPTAVQGGRARKCYRLTAKGQRSLDLAASMLARMLQGWRPRTEGS
jgi:DNA-binding PadR family transcriptional regulator